MEKHKRGPDRRACRAVNARTTDERERREGNDRRRHGYISKLDLCRGLPYETLEPIFEHCPITELAAGETLLEPGQANHHLYFLLEGRLEVRIQSVDSPVADIIEVGECIGEMSIIDGEPTSANVTASESSAVLAVHEDVFWSQIAASPAAMRNLSRVLAERMRKRNDATLRALQREIRLEQLEKELAAAAEIQIGMLPAGPALLRDFPTLDVFGLTNVAKAVGGDLYDAFRLDEQRICVAIGDVSGKGMPAALFMVQAVTLLHVEMNKSTDLVTAMTRINRALCETNISHMFVSLIVATIDTRTGILTYVNAGHPPFLAAQGDGPFAAVETSVGLIAGVLEDTVYETGELTLGSGDRLLLYTDGISEARDPARKFYGAERLRAFLNARPVTDATGCVNAVFDDVLQFTGGMPQSDDVTALAVTFRL